MINETQLIFDKIDSIILDLQRIKEQIKECECSKNNKTTFRSSILPDRFNSTSEPIFKNSYLPYKD